MLRTPLQILVALALLAPGRTARAQVDSALIARVQRVSVRSLDSTLAATSLADWLVSLRVVGSPPIDWETNDCGEGGDGRRAPTCVEAIIRLGQDTTAHISLIAAGIDGAPATPQVFMLYAIAGQVTVHFGMLREWAAFVRGRRGLSMAQFSK
jgi:hypothetical protein